MVACFPLREESRWTGVREVMGMSGPIILGMESFGAWIGATIFISILSGVLFRRFYEEGWRDINIFIHTQTGATNAFPRTAW